MKNLHFIYWVLVNFQYISFFSVRSYGILRVPWSFTVYSCTEENRCETHYTSGRKPHLFFPIVSTYNMFQLQSLYGSEIRKFALNNNLTVIFTEAKFQYIKSSIVLLAKHRSFIISFQGNNGIEQSLLICDAVALLNGIDSEGLSRVLEEQILGVPHTSDTLF